jgi:transposase
VRRIASLVNIAGCLVAMEACERALGWDARLIAAHFVTVYRMEGKNGKNDATDAAAICEAASAKHPLRAGQDLRSAGRDEPAPCARSVEEERTACINQIRGVLTQFGLAFGRRSKVLGAPC